MAKKNNNNGVENKNKNNDGGEKKKKAIASKIVKWVKSFQGTESVKSEVQANKLTVVGKVDPTKLRDELANNKVNKDDANDTKKKQPEKTDNDEKAKEAPLTTAVMKLDFQSQKCTTRAVKIAASTTGCKSASANTRKGLPPAKRKSVKKMIFSKLIEQIVLLQTKKNGGNDNDENNDNDGDEGGGGGGGGGGGRGGDEKKKEEDEGNGGGKMKYPAGQSGFGQFSYGRPTRHKYGYQNGALKTEEKMLLLCCEVFGLLVMYNHLAKDIYTMSIHSQRVFSGVQSHVYIPYLQGM